MTPPEGADPARQRLVAAVIADAFERRYAELLGKTLDRFLSQVLLRTNGKRHGFLRVGMLQDNAADDRFFATQVLQAVIELRHALENR